MTAPPREGKPNIFMVPTERNMNATAIRMTDNTHGAIGELRKPAT